MDINERIKAYRKEQGMTQKQLADELGITQQAIAKYENGDRSPSLEVIGQISEALGRDILFEDVNVEYELIKLLCRRVDVRAELIPHKETVGGNNESLTNYFHFLGANDEQICAAKSSVVYGLIDRFIEHMAIDFKAFLEENGAAEERDNKEV